ncbi:hypothetical protein [Streptomyces sp. NPDC005549]|uniref:hypothetical protein n=1 Tax=Streptomyces sp. NPDC005549 TaxID=3154888 RepID=UPI0033A27885
MTTGPGMRTGRAAVFAAVCVLLTALAHSLMSTPSVPWWALGAGAAATGSAAWLLAGSERGRVTVVGVAIAAQAALHSLFSLAQVLAQPQSSGGSLARQWIIHALCGAPTDAASSGVRTSMNSSGMASMGAMDMESMRHSVPAANALPLGHDMGGVSPLGMLLAHLLAAMLCGLWLAYGEQAVFRIARSFAAWLIGSLHPVLRLAAPPHRPAAHLRRSRAERAPRLLLLTHTITSRGPPTGTAVA